MVERVNFSQCKSLVNATETERLILVLDEGAAAATLSAEMLPFA